MNVLFARFPWPKRDFTSALRKRLRDHCELRVFRALESDEGCAYAVPSAGQDEMQRIEDSVHAALAAVTTSRLVLLMDLAGASAGEAAPYHYIVETDVLAEREADFNAWYDREHLAGLASVPGTVRAMRFRNIDGHPRYHACYDLARPETLGSPPWLAVRRTPWSDRVRPAFFNTKQNHLARWSD